MPETTKLRVAARRCFGNTNEIEFRKNDDYDRDYHSSQRTQKSRINEISFDYSSTGIIDKKKSSRNGQTAHWSLINCDFVVKDKDETENMIFTFYRDEDGSVTINYLKNNFNVETKHAFEGNMFKIRFHINGNAMYKWFAIEYNNFINQQETDVEYTMLHVLAQKIRTKVIRIFQELENEQQK
ncbi:unnamed protein product [Rotaria socialis]|uniref:Uncharacterized protein n=2 Tax=Rotaria socialis TaxID=392032 RepID=A0A818CG37_9BILA|nr:unnamed protein product [Rotaria socialis]